MRKHQLSTAQLSSFLLVAAMAGFMLATLFSGTVGASPAAALAAPSLADRAIPEEKGSPVVHFEIGCKDTAATKKFYSDVFGWKVSGTGMAATIQTGAGKGIDGHITALGHEPHHYVTVYAEVPDINTTLDKAKALGGKTLVPPIKIPTGRFAWFSDPEGNMIGLLEPKK